MIGRCRKCGRFKSSDGRRLCWMCQDERDAQKMQRDFQRAREWARQILENNAVILDTETTGLNGYLVEIAVLDCAGAVVVNSLVNPQVEIEDEAFRVHGLTLAALQDAPTYECIHDVLDAALRGRTVLVYNLSFDVQILLNEMRRLGSRSTDKLLFGAVAWEDLMEPYSAFVGDLRRGEYRWQRLPGGRSHGARGLSGCVDGSL